MKKRRIGSIFALLFAVLLIFSSCDLTEAIEQVEDFAEEKGFLPQGEAYEYYVAFSEKEAKTTEELSLEDGMEYEDYKSRYASLRSSVYLDNLSSEEKHIYHLFERALDEGCPYLYVDDALLDKAKRDPADILYFLSLDSAMVEQNLSFTHSTVKMTPSRESGEVLLHLYQVDAFSEERLEKKEEAIEAAERIVQSTSPGLSQEEIARAYYDYLTENVTYRDYRVQDDPHYLYDALIKKETHCDGFSNAYSLLCHLSGIDCFEKGDDGTESEAGHTWNTVFFNEVWWNVDCALAEEVVKEQEKHGIPVRFAFSDQRQTAEAEYASLLPPCTEDYLPLDCDFEGDRDPSIPKKIAAAFGTGGKRYVLFRLRDGQLSQSTMQSIANETQGSYDVLGYSWGEDLYYIFIRK